jgi:hypothetical protein
VAGSENDDNGEIVYRYSREHRLARASSAVQELNDGKPVKAGFVRRTAGTKGTLFMLAAVLIICVTSIFISRSSRIDSGEFLLGENTVSFRIENFRDENTGGDSLILHINKKAPKTGSGAEGVYTGAVDLAISPVTAGSAEDGEAAPVMNHRIFFTFNNNETYSAALPFGGERFLIVIQTESECVVRRISARG